MTDTVFEKIEFKKGNRETDSSLSTIFLRQQNYKDAILYLKKALTIAKASKSFSGIALLQQDIGYAYTKLNLFPEAKEWCEKAEQSAISYNDKLL